MPYNEAKKKKTEKRNNARDNQTPKELIPTTKLKDAFTLNAHPQVGKGNTRRDGIRIDNKQAHHSGVPLDVYTSYTEGFTEEQIKATDNALARQGVVAGNHTLNKVDLWGRYHQGRKSGPYKGQGSHQRTLALGIDGTKVKNNYAAMSPAQRFAGLDGFVSNMGTNRSIAQQSDMDSRMLLGKNNTPDNEFGGNFTQRILNPRDPEKAAQMAANAKEQRKLYKPEVKRELAPHHQQAPTAKAKPPKTSKVKLPKTSKVKLPKVNIPVAGGLLAAGATLLSGGDAMAAAGEFIEAENPLSGGALADGTVTGYEQERNNNPLHYGKNGPNVPRPGQRERAQELRINPSDEMRGERHGRYVKDAWNAIKSLFIK